MRVTLAVLGMASAAAVAWGQTSISGRVEDGAGKPVTGATVVLYPRPPLTMAAGSPRVQTGPDGVFQFGGLTAGPYQVCAGAPQQDYPDTCAWDAAGPRGNVVSVSAGQRLQVPAIRLAQGARVRVNFTDPAGLLERDEPRPYSRLLVTAAVPGIGYALLPVAEKGGTQRGYEMLAPRGRAVKIRVVSNHFSIADGQGRPVNAVGHDLEVAVPSAGSVAPITFRVTAAAGR